MRVDLGVGEGDHRQEADRQLDQVHRSVRALAVELQRVAGVQPVHRTTVAVVHDALEHVDELGARVLEQRIGLALRRQRDLEALEALVLTAQRAEQLVLVALPGAVAHDARTGARLDECRGTLDVRAAEQAGDRNVETLGQQGQRAQAARGLGILDLGHHRLRNADAGRHFGDGEPVLQAELTDVTPDRGLELELLDGRLRIAVTGGAGFVAEQRDVRHASGAGGQRICPAPTYGYGGSAAGRPSAKRDSLKSGLRNARVGAAAIDDEVGDQPADGGRDLESVPAEPRGDDEPVDPGSC